MIAQKVLSLAQRHQQSVALVIANERRTYSQLAESALSVAAQIKGCAYKRVGVWCEGMQTLLSTLLALDSLGADVVLLSPSATVDQVRKSAIDLQLMDVVTNQLPDRTLADGGKTQFRSIDLSANRSVTDVEHQVNCSRQVVLFTSGTSSQPKPAIHNWETLSAGVNYESKYANRRWLLAYESTSFAGIQVWLQALLTGGCLCVPETREPTAVAQFLLRERIEFASATPSFWRLLLLSVSNQELSKAALVQITLGGEAVDQPLLDSLRSTFREARITHVYASTEMGMCFSVSDGLAGFPASFLSNFALPCQLRIGSEGELEILSRRGMLGYISAENRSETGEQANVNDASPWFATGDLVEQRGDRIYFVGRKLETINIGGAKVYPADVERCIRSVPGVQQVRVYGVSSSLTGQLVAAEIQPAAEIDREHLRADILATCRQRLVRHQVPARITFCDLLPLNSSGKLVRREVLHGT